MIGKVCRRGTDTRRLLVYLFTEGRVGEHGLDAAHQDARVIGGWDTLRVLEPPRGPGGRAEVSRLAALLDAQVQAGGVGKDAKPVYHLAISAAPTDRLLSDSEWADIAAEYVDRLGLAPAVTVTRSGGSRSGTPTTTSTSSRHWSAKTATGWSRSTTSTAHATPAGRSNSGTD